MMRVESWIVSPSSTRTGSAFCPVIQRTRGTWKPGRSERRTCAMPFQSSAQRAFSLYCEKRNCKRTGGANATRPRPGGRRSRSETLLASRFACTASRRARFSYRWSGYGEQLEGVAPVRASEALGRVAVRVVEYVGEELCLL